MKTKELLLLSLFAFVSLGINAGSFQGIAKRISLEKHSSETSPKKGKRSVATLEAFAYLNLDNELISIDLKNGIVNAEVSIVNLSTNEIVCSELHSGSEIIILSLSGLLNEGEVYRLEITIEDTVLYGDFSL